MEKSWLSTASALITLKTWLSMGAILVVAAVLLLSGCAARVEERTTPAAAPDVGSAPDDGEAQSSSSSGWDLSTQRNDAGRVEIDVTPLALDGDTWEFEVAFNTHTVDLGFDLTEVGALRCDRGQEFDAVAWEGSGPGGHHRSGVLKFPALDHPTSYIEVVIRDVAKVPERIFKWDVPGEVESPADNSVTQPLSPQSPSAAADGPARVTLADQEFHFGDVVLSRGAVDQTMNITNTGGDVLRVEGVEPT
jgi:hypothetical protein